MIGFSRDAGDEGGSGKFWATRSTSQRQRSFTTRPPRSALGRIADVA